MKIDVLASRCEACDKARGKPPPRQGAGLTAALGHNLVSLPPLLYLVAHRYGALQGAFADKDHKRSMQLECNPKANAPTRLSP